MAQGDDVMPIPSSKRIRHLRDIAAPVGVRLIDTEMHEIDQALAALAFVGPRYIDEGVKGVDA